MSLATLIADCIQAGVTLTLNGDGIDIHAPEGALTPELINSLKTNKADLIEWLKSQANEADNSNAMTRLGKREADQPPLLSFNQQRLWLLDQIEPDSSQYNIPAVLQLHGQLNQPALIRALTTILSRHEVLRTCYRSHDGEPVPVLTDGVDYDCPLVDLSALDDRHQQLQRLTHQAATQSFDLAHDLMLRTTLVKLAPHEHVLLVTLHHIAADGWSVGLLTRELSHLYQAFIGHGDNPLVPLPLQYSDYAVWQRRHLQQQVLQQQLDFWCTRLEELPAVHQLPLDRPRPAQQSYQGAHHLQTLPLSLAQGLNALAGQHQASLFMLLHAAYACLIGRYSGENDIVMGTPVANREQSELASLVGFFANTLVLRADLSADPDFITLLAQSKQYLLAAYNHQQLPFEQLLDKLQPERNLGQSPLFQLLLVLQNHQEPVLQMPGLTLTPQEQSSSTAKLDLSLYISETAEGLELIWEYATDLFDASTIEQLSGHFEVLLGGIVATPECSISQLPLLSTQQQQQRLPPNQQSMAKAADNIVAQIEYQAATNPAAIALVDGNNNLSYQALNLEANQLANHLMNNGVSAGTLVGLCIERSASMVTGLLAILKAGGAYLPLDPAYPPARLNFMLKDSGVKWLLGKQDLFAQLSLPQDCQCFCLDNLALSQTLAQSEVQNPSLQIASTQQMAYMIYTSGSTGVPKGVMISHAGLANYVMAAQQHYAVGVNDRVMQFASISFDACIEEVFVTLSAGAKLVLRNDAVLDGGQHFWDFVARHHISVIALPTAFWHLLTGALTADTKAIAKRYLRLCIIGGEAVQPAKVSQWQADVAISLLNTYGPTEATVVATVSDLSEVDLSNTVNAPIGRPLANYTTYVLDQHQKRQPVGVVGELYIGGDSLALGYFNRPELIASTFVASPFSAGRLYRTGDRVRRLKDGQLVFVGRLDRQLKIRGFRVEPGEISTRLNQQALVQQAVVLADNSKATEIKLVAYVVLDAEGQQLSEAAALAQLRNGLMQVLPDYMIPAIFMLLEQMPLTANGKLDQAALPPPQPIKTVTADHQTPQNALERQLVRLWGQLLDQPDDGLSCEANFFALGGHSLLASQMIHQGARDYDLALEMRDLFVAPTIRQLAALLAQRNVEQRPVRALTHHPVPSPEQDKMALSYAQYRVWFVEHLQGSSNQNNIAIGIRINGVVCPSLLQRSYQQLVQQHVILRTRFILEGDEPQQQVMADCPFELAYHDLSALPEAEKQRVTAQKIEQHDGKPFDIYRLPLLGALLLKLGDTEYRLHGNFHHLISDGWSVAIFFDQLFKVYQQLQQNQQTKVIANNDAQSPTYRDYVLWQQAFLQSAEVKEQQQFWRDYLAGCHEQLVLPFENMTFERMTFESMADDEQTVPDRLIQPPIRDALVALAQSCQGSLFNVLHSALVVLLARVTGSHDLNIGVPVTGRNIVGCEAIQGNFLNNLPVRSKVSGDTLFNDFLQQQIGNMEQVLYHQDLPFEQILEQARVSRSKDSTPLFQVFLNMLSLPAINHQSDDLQFARDAIPPLDNKFKLSIYISDSGGDSDGNSGEGIRLHCSYDRQLLPAAGLNLLMQQYCQLLEQLAANSHKACHDYSLRTADSQLPNPALPLPRHGAANEVFVGVAGLFAQMARHTPDNVAMDFAGRRWSYNELVLHSDYYAAQLQASGVVRGDVVGIFAERNDTLVVAVLAVLKAGAAFMMLSRQAPAARVMAQLSQVHAKVVVCLNQQGWPNAQIADHAHQLGCQQLTIDSQPVCPPTTFVAVPVAPDDMAYIAFTSGTEGKQKAVMGRHSSLTAFMPTMVQRFGLSATDRFAMLSGLVHDPLQRDMFTPLCLGACLYIPDDGLISGSRLAGWLGDKQVSVLHLTPSLGEQLVMLGDAPIESLRLGFFVGEPLVAERLQRLQKMAANMTVVNLYGSTETGRAVSCFVTEQSNQHSKQQPTKQKRTILPLGKGIDGVELLLLNSNLKPCGYGEVGQVGIRSEHLSLGYYQQEALTAERFIDNPFTQGGGAQTAQDKIYLTGDLGRYRLDGHVESLGRLDSQVKIRGFRIEPAEIVYALDQHPLVLHSEVVVYQDNHEDSVPMLVAYLVLQSRQTDNKAAIEEIRLHLAGQLPGQMIPAHWQLLAQMPLTENGKLDRQALGALPLTAMVDNHTVVAPATDTERELLAIWLAIFAQTALPVKTISVNDDFFDLGGHSLLATRLLLRSKAHFEQEISLTEFFGASTIAGMAALIDQHQQLKNVVKRSLSTNKNQMML